MTKPSITKRSVKGAALTYNELDANFQNLKDATVTLTAGTGGTAVTSDLNGNITLKAGSGISLSGDNTTKEITITGTTSVTGLTNPLTSDLDLGSYKIKDTSGAATISTAGLKIESTSGSDSIQISPNGTGLYTIDCADNKDLTIRTFVSGSVGARMTLDHDTGVNFGTGDITRTVSVSDGAFLVASMTTTQRNTITAINGMIIYNSTVGSLQGYNAGSWANLGVVTGPAFRAYPSTAQTITSSGTQQKVNFGTESFDTDGCFTSSRFTPTVEGYYQLNSVVRLDGGGSGTGEAMITIWKNGSEYARGTNESGTEQGSSFFSMQVSDIAYANGTTDYFEIYIQQVSGASRTTTPYSNISFFSGSMIRRA